MKYLDYTGNYVLIAIAFGIVLVIAGIACAFGLYNKFFK